MDTIALSELNDIDRVLRSYPWMDFELYGWIRGDVTLIGGIDLHGPAPDVLLHFEDALALIAPREWKTDTSQRVLSLVQGSAEVEMRQAYRIGLAHSIFQLRAEDCDAPCRIVARAVQMIQQRPPDVPLRHPAAWADLKPGGT